jgi:hypothetical protein
LRLPDWVEDTQANRTNPTVEDRMRFTVIRDALREEAASVLREYAESGGEIYTTPARAAPRDGTPSGTA